MAKTDKSETKAITAPGTTAPSTFNPFTRATDDRLAHGAVAIESERAIAEAQAQIVVAKRFPRDPHAAFERLAQACARPGLAEEAFYRYPRGGQQVEGPSIRLAEEMARAWGNFDYGLRELSNSDGVSELEAYAWDLEANVRTKQQFTVRHIRDKRDGGAVLTDQRDIYEITANMGARRMRARILALLPAEFVDQGVALCKATIAGKVTRETPKERTARGDRMVAAFAKHGVTPEMIAAKIGRKIDALTAEDFVTLTSIHTALADGGKVADHFAPATVAAPAPALPAKAQEEQKAAEPAPAAAPAKDEAAKPARRSTKNVDEAPTQPPESTEPASAAPAPEVDFFEE